jgi:hypothetical protein
MSKIKSSSTGTENKYRKQTTRSKNTNQQDEQDHIYREELQNKRENEHQEHLAKQEANIRGIITLTEGCNSIQGS